MFTLEHRASTNHDKEVLELEMEGKWNSRREMEFKKGKGSIKGRVKRRTYKLPCSIIIVLLSFVCI